MDNDTKAKFRNLPVRIVFAAAGHPKGKVSFMKTVSTLLVLLALAGCAGAPSAGCSASIGLAAGCSEGQNPVPYGD